MASTAEALAAEFAALNKATERAHAVLADLRAERALLAGERAAAEAVRADVRELVAGAVQTLIEDTVRDQLDQLGPKVKAHMDASVAKVGDSFKRMENLYLGLGDRSIPIEDLFVERVAREVVAITKRNGHPRLIRPKGE